MNAHRDGVTPDDLSALAWVQDELRRSLESAHKALRRFLRETESTYDSDVDSVDPSVLRAARQQLHQGVGALELVGLPAAATMLRASETAVQRFANKANKVDLDSVEVIEQASFALLDYLGRRLGGKPVSPLAMFPQYRNVQALVGADRVHPADLWEFDWRWHDVPVERGVAGRPCDRHARADLESKLLPAMRGDAVACAGLSDLAASLAAGATEPHTRALWDLAAAHFEAQALGVIKADVYSKRVASRLLAQARLFEQGNHEVADRLAQDLLFFCSQASQSRNGQRSPRLDAVRQRYGLAAAEPVDYETPRLGRVDPAAVVQARKRVAAAKDAWSGVAGGELHRLPGLSEQFALVCDSLQRLHDGGSVLAQALHEAVQHTVQTNAAPAPALAMEIATAMLYLEATLEDGEFDHPEQAARTQRLAERIAQTRQGQKGGPLEPWMEELYRRVSDRQTMGSVVQELRSSLLESEKVIDQFFRNPSEPQALMPVPAQLSAMRGVLSVLGMDQASQAVLRMRDEVDSWIAAPSFDPTTLAESGRFERLASNIGALGFLIDMLSVQPQLAKSLFVYDAVTGTLNPLMGRGAEPPTVAAMVPAAPKVEPRLIEQALSLATSAADEAIPVAEVTQQLQRMSHDALAADQPALAETIHTARRNLEGASDASGIEAARGQLVEVLNEFVLTASEPVGLDPLSPAPAAQQPAPASTGLEEDDEMLGVFLEEAREVAANAHEALLALAAAPGDVEQLTSVRRAFHTLKGSSRMVGLTDFGEAAWACEQLYNARLADAPRADPELLAFTTQAFDYFRDWVDSIESKRPRGHDAAVVREAADQLRNGKPAIALALPTRAATAVSRVDVERAGQVALDPVSLDFGNAMPIDATAGPEVVEFPAAAVPAIDAPNFKIDLRMLDGPEAAPALVPVEPMPSGSATEELVADEPPVSPFEATMPMPTLPEPEAPVAEASWDSVDFDLRTTTGALEPLPMVDDRSEPVASGTADVSEVPPAVQPSAADGWATHEGPMASEMPAVDLAIPEAAVEDPPADIALPIADFAAEPLLAEWGAEPATVEAAEVFGVVDSPIGDAVTPAPDLVADAGMSAGVSSFDVDAVAVADVVVDEPVVADADMASLDPSGTEFDLPYETGAAVADGIDASLTETVVPDALTEVPPPVDPDVKVIGDLRVSAPLFNIYLTEADELSRRLTTELAEWAMELHRPVGEMAEAHAHSLAGSSSAVGFADLSHLARTLEHALTRCNAIGRGDADEARLFVDAAEEIRRLLHQFAAGFLLKPEPSLLERLARHEIESARRLEALAAAPEPLAARVAFDEVRADAPADAALPQAAPVVAAALGQVELKSFEAMPLVPAAGIREASIVAADDIDAIDAVDPELFPIFEEEGQELLPQLATRLRDWQRRPTDAAGASNCMRTLHTLKGGARLAGAMRLGELAHRLETAIEQLLARGDVTADDVEALQGRVDALAATFEALRQGDAAAHEERVSAVDAPMPQVVEPLPRVAEVLPRPVAEPSPIEPARAKPVVQDAVPAEPPTRPAQKTAIQLGEIDWSRFTAQEALAHAAAAERRATERIGSTLGAAVRVRGPLLDRLVNHAGEVSIARSRIEGDVAQIRSSLSDLTDNLDRLRRQLHDIELQAETQISSRMEAARAASQAFDPLELDRFTRFQELTRMMAESVNDVATVQRTLSRSLQSTEDELATQARLTRDLQDDLLRTRMVEFESLSDRLYRVVRQAAKEMGKQVRLDIVGGSIEIDRGVLERMTGSFEHLLRNCVTHGIEMPEQRNAAGKDATGSVTVSLGHEGNEVSVEFRDDGAGLNLPKIRERGIAMGLLDVQAQPSDSDLANLIFQPGMSTADSVTELAGRGVGMDVVRAEVNAMGGRIETATAAGKGSSFKLVLPLTTAVTRVVMMRSGDMVIAVPSTLVEIVRRARPEELQQSYTSGVYLSGERALPFFWLGALLQTSARSAETARTMPVIVVRSAQQRVALHVDEVLGNQEVVVKNLGPQLSRMPGLAGITLLASGAVALIYNPVALATMYGDAARAMTRAALATPEVTDLVPAEPQAPQAVQAPLVMVVDDSLTVRRVTQRLLTREGYRVTVAKDGLEALERLAEERPAVLLSDIEMPRMDGFDLVRNVRNDGRWRDLPVIMITSRIAQKHRDVAMELGVEHYLGKPYSEEDLLALVARYASSVVA